MLQKTSPIFVSNTLLQRKLKISLNTAFRLKRAAHAAGFLEIVPNLQPTGHHVCYKNQFLKGLPELTNVTRVKDRMLFLQGSDQIISKIRFKRRKKIETLIRGS